MKTKVAFFLLAGLSAFAARAAEPSKTFECIFEPPTGTSLRDGEFVTRPVNFKNMDSPWIYQFTLASVEPGNRTTLKVASKQDFATISGEYSALAVAPDTYVATAVKTGGCMFSSGICGAFIQLTDLDSEVAAASLNPISYFGDQKDAQFFHVDLVGKCKAVSEDVIKK